MRQALSAALQEWQLETGHTLRYWLRGYCSCFATTLVTFIGEPASLSSVVASDGNVHHIVVALYDLVIDARGVNTKKSLLAEINREAEANGSSLRAVDVIPFESQHERLLRECPGGQARALKACFNTPLCAVFAAGSRWSRLAEIGPVPNEVTRDVLTQYADVIEQRRAKVKQNAGGGKPDLRTGCMLWQSSLREFLYFEEETIPPDPRLYFAEWRKSGGGLRNASKNLWVYEKETGQKRYSITTAAGAKIQPYFDVHPPTDPNIYILKVQGEEISPGVVRIWIAAPTARELARAIGDVGRENLSLMITNAAAEQGDGESPQISMKEEAIGLTLTTESYNLLVSMFPGAVSDEHMAQLLVTRLRK
jgi:hypothetical protein